MLTTARLDTALTYLILAYAAVMGFSRGGINTVFWLTVLLAIGRFLWKPYRIPAESEVVRALAIFFGALLLSSLFSGDITASLKYLALSITKILPFFLVLAFIRCRRHIEQAATLMSASLLIGAAIALWQAAQGQIRVKSTLGTMDFAGAIGLIIPVLLVKSFDREAKPWVRCLSAVSLVAAMAALIFNATRAVWVSTLVSFGLFAFLNLLVSGRKGAKTAVVVVVVLAAVLSFALSSTTFINRFQASTLQSNAIHKRLVAWEYAWHQFQDHWFLGVGLATLPEFFPENIPAAGPDRVYGHVHNNFLQMLAENGLVGGLSFIFLFWSILKTSFQRLKEPATRNWAMIALLCTVDFLVHGMFDYTFTIATIMYSYWFILGLAYSSFSLSTQQRG